MLKQVQHDNYDYAQTSKFGSQIFYEHYFNQIKYPFDTKFIKVNDYEIAYVDEGNSENVLLFIHGLGSYLKAWDRNIPELKNHFRCIAFDLPGYGKSSKQIHSGEVSFMFEILNEFITKLNLKSVSLVGHSMGGQITLAYVFKKFKPNCKANISGSCRI